MTALSQNLELNDCQSRTSKSNCNHFSQSVSLRHSELTAGRTAASPAEISGAANSGTGGMMRTRLFVRGLSRSLSGAVRSGEKEPKGVGWVADGTAQERVRGAVPGGSYFN